MDITHQKIFEIQEILDNTELKTGVINWNFA